MEHGHAVLEIPDVNYAKLSLFPNQDFTHAWSYGPHRPPVNRIQAMLQAIQLESRLAADRFRKRTDRL